MFVPISATSRLDLWASSQIITLHITLQGESSMKYFLSALATIAALTLIPQTAQASGYKNTSGSTKLQFIETGGPANVGTWGQYYTTISGAQWVGEFQATTVSVSGGIRTYTGTFTDRKMSSGPGPSCVGTIVLKRSVNNPGPAPLTVKWTITGNGSSQPCPVPNGTISTLNLTEALPGANASGDFNAANANTLKSAPPSSPGLPVLDVTWSRWQVVDPSGLNCRSSAPSGSVVTVFPNGTIVDAATTYPNSNAFITASGQSWMKVFVNPNANNNTCYVRANSMRIMPKLMPF
jgi:hypothetical protein